MEQAVVDNSISNKKMKDNIRLYTKYRIVGYDVLFYYAISVLYFTLAKGLSMSEVLFLSGTYTLSVALWQLVSNFIVEKIGLKSSIILGNIFACIMIVIYLIGPNFWYLVVANIIGALGFSLKLLSESNLLFASLSALKKPTLFTKFEGIANSRYFYTDAIFSILAGYLFFISPYTSMILCLICMLIALYLSTKFNYTKNTNVKHIKIKEYMQGLKSVINSSRARSILLFAFLIAGIISTNTNLYKAIVLDFNVTSDILAYIVCGFTIVIGIGSKFGKQLEINLKNKTLITILVIICCMLAIMGIIGLTQTFSITKIVAIVLSLCVMGVMVGSYRVLIKKYVTSFTTPLVRTKITSLYCMAENLGGTAMLFLSGVILKYCSNSLTAIIIACLTLLLGVLVYKYANKRLGLRPEQYNPADINYIYINTKM